MRGGSVKLTPGESVGWHSTNDQEEALTILHGSGVAKIVTCTFLVPTAWAGKTRVELNSLTLAPEGATYHVGSSTRLNVLLAEVTVGLCAWAWPHEGG